MAENDPAGSALHMEENTTQSPSSFSVGKKRESPVQAVDIVTKPHHEGRDDEEVAVGNHSADEHGVVVTDANNLPAAKRKKKKRRKPASKRGMGAPDGFEKFFADSPMSPEEAAEDQQLYDKEQPFIDRLLTAIQRFERTRRLLPERRDVFYKWLHYGGIKVSGAPFTGGLDQENMDKDEIASALSKVMIPVDVRADLETVDSKDPKYAVDFLGCMQGFLSYKAPAIYFFGKRENVELVTGTLERFMDYIMQHDVCPEYHNDILATRNFCREAANEMWSVSEAQRWLPGDFNMACSILFGGNYSTMYDGKTFWGDLQPGESAFVGFTPKQATQIVGLGIAGAASEEVYNRYAELISDEDGSALETTKVIAGAGFEIMDLEDPTADCKDLYKNNSSEYRPVGRVLAVPWKSSMSPPDDLTDEEKRKSQTLGEVSPYVFFVEQIILQYLSVGQKIVATVRQLNCGAWFFDEFTLIYPNFEFWTPNDMVEDYKIPKMYPGAYAPGAGNEPVDELDMEQQEGPENASQI